MFFSLDVVAFLVKNPPSKSNFISDDIAITRHLVSKGYFVTPIRRSNPNTSHLYFPATHYRMKSSHNGFFASERMKLFYRLGNSKSLDAKFRAFQDLLRFEIMSLKHTPRGVVGICLDLYGLTLNRIAAIRLSRLKR
jgi:hypothetical protein